MQNSNCGRFRTPFFVGLALGLLLLLLPLAALGDVPPENLLPAVPTAIVRPSAGIGTGTSGNTGADGTDSPDAAVSREPGMASQAGGMSGQAATAASSSAAGNLDASATIRVLMPDGVTVQKLTLQEYLWRVVSAEMPATFSEEALKAQAVCARTYAFWRARAGSHSAQGADVCASSSCCQAYRDPQDMAQRWGSEAENYAARIRDAVSATDGQVLTWEGKPIQAVFFSSSSGKTEDAAAVWGNALPYLVPVDSPEGEEVPNWHSMAVFSPEEVRTLAAGAGLGANLSGDPSSWFSGITRTDSGRVASLKLGGAALSGGAARNLFSLRSAAFDITWDGSAFHFSVTGYGHGVGLSQYGANAMANQGATWQEIVSHYYTGVSIDTAVF